jgi:hypothetical protein
MTEAPFDREKTHRYFAVECNNRAWDLIEKENRTADESQEMIHLAHASAWHWQQVGTPLNRLRSMCLLATAYLAAHQSSAAVRYADECVALSEQLGNEQTAFDRATALGCAACAHGLAGHDPDASEYRQHADDAARALSDEQDRAVYERLYGAHRRT